MPEETPRNRVGRFAGATLRDEQPEKVKLEPEKNEEEKEGLCRRWFRKMCPCCCRKATNKPGDAGIELTVEPDGQKEKLTTETNETNGEVLNAVHQGGDEIPLNTTYS